MEGLLEDPGDVRRPFDNVAVFGKGFRRAGDVRLLEHIPPQQVAADLAGDDHQGNGIHIRGGDAGEQVGGAGAGGGDAHAGTAGDAGVAAGRVSGVLLGAHQNMMDRRIRQTIVKGADGGAGITERHAHLFGFQAFDHCHSACYHD